MADREPRYRLLDGDNNIVGVFYEKADGSIAIQEGNSGSDTEITIDGDGLSTPAIDTELQSITDLVTATYPTSETTVASDNSDHKINLSDGEDELGALNDSNNSVDVPTDGKYLLSGYAYWKQDSGWSTGDQSTVRIFVNGSPLAFSTNRKIGTGPQNIQTNTHVKSLTAGDSVSLRARQS